MKYRIEIKGAEGGDDAKLFVADLSNAYVKWAQKSGWIASVIEKSASETHVLITGDDISDLMKESGGHRIQRVPPTEKRGRVHTSTVTVAVFDIDDHQPISNFSEKDLEVQWFSGSGAGGQHRNKHQNSCRIKHLPTGLITSAQTRSRESSYRLALDELKNRVDFLSESAYYNDIANSRSSQRGSGMRGDKIRTYRFQDDRVTDHRTNKTAKCRDVISGKFELLW